MTHDPNYDTKQAAAYLATSESYLEQLRWRGGGPVYWKRGRMVRYRRSALDAWIDSHGTRRHTSQAEADPVPERKPPLPRLRLKESA